MTMVLPFHKYLWIAVVVAYISSGFLMKAMQDFKCYSLKRFSLEDDSKFNIRDESLVRVLLKVSSMVLLHSVHLK